MSALADLSGLWIDLVHGRRPPKGIVLDTDSSVSSTYGEQENSAWNGHYACTCYHPLFVFNQFGDLERCALRPGNVHSAEGWGDVLKPVVVRYQGKVLRIYSVQMRLSAMPGSTSISKPSGSSMRSVFQPIRSSGQDWLPAQAPSRSPSERCSRYYANFSYQAGSWTGPRRVIAKVEWHPGELVPRVGFIVTNMSRPAERVVAFYNGAARANNGSRKAKVRLGGRGCRAERSRPMQCGSNFMHTRLQRQATFSARWRHPSRSRIGR